MQKTFWTLLVFTALACAPRAVAQPLGIGVKLGTTLTDAISSAQSASLPQSDTLIVGPYLELRLGNAFAIEADALYLPGLYSNTAGGGSVWQFPILAKFRLLSGPIAPYLEGGPSYSHLSDVKTLPDLLHSSNYGLVLGGGIEFKVAHIRIAPEIRYNGFVFTNIENPLGLFKSNRSQAVFMVGFGF